MIFMIEAYDILLVPVRYDATKSSMQQKCYLGIWWGRGCSGAGGLFMSDRAAWNLATQANATELTYEHALTVWCLWIS